jgi:hypothetical protein
MLRKKAEAQRPGPLLVQSKRCKERLTGSLLACAARTAPVLAGATGGLRIVGLAKLGAAEVSTAAAIGNVSFRPTLKLGCIGLAHRIFPLLNRNRLRPGGRGASNRF